MYVNFFNKVIDNNSPLVWFMSIISFILYRSYINVKYIWKNRFIRRSHRFVVATEDFKISCDILPENRSHQI
jgi:hypothetical protein